MKFVAPYLIGAGFGLTFVGCVLSFFHASKARHDHATIKLYRLFLKVGVVIMAIGILLAIIS